MPEHNAFLKDATNVYRTKHFIVKQVIQIKYDKREDNIVCSYDTFYARTKDRDEVYEALFCNRKKINGRRIATTMYARTYIL